MDHEQFIEGVVPDLLCVNPVVHKEVFDRYFRVKINLLLWLLQPHRSLLAHAHHNALVSGTPLVMDREHSSKDTIINKTSFECAGAIVNESSVLSSPMAIIRGRPREQ